MTALTHASRRDNTSFATLLLEYGANINATSTSGQTPLTTAVAYNSHNILRLLLDRWFEYSVCPRLTGPHLLQIVALYADVETISILTDTDHFHLKYDSSYALGDFLIRLRERPDITEKLILAFDGLLEVIKQGRLRLADKATRISWNLAWPIPMQVILMARSLRMRWRTSTL